MESSPPSLEGADEKYIPAVARVSIFYTAKFLHESEALFFDFVNPYIYAAKFPNKSEVIFDIEGPYIFAARHKSGH